MLSVLSAAGRQEFNVRVFLCLRKLQTTTTPIHSNIVTVNSLHLLLNPPPIISYHICQHFPHHRIILGYFHSKCRSNRIYEKANWCVAPVWAIVLLGLWSQPQSLNFSTATPPRPPGLPRIEEILSSFLFYKMNFSWTLQRHPDTSI